MANEEEKRRFISAGEVGNYVVCPEGWRLKYLGKAPHKERPQARKGTELRQEWLDSENLSAQLRKYAKIAYYLLLLLVIVVFIWDVAKRSNTKDNTQLRAQPAAVASAAQLARSAPHSIRSKVLEARRIIPNEILYLLLVLGLLIFFWDLFDRHSRRLRKQTGLDEGTDVIELKQSTYLPSKKYISAKLGLVSKPDALLKEGTFIIPVDRRPIGKKVRDRHIAQLLVHMQVVEEQEGTAPPYGLLLLGPKARTVKIKNTEERQRWLESLVDEMRSIIDGIPAQPTPSRMKCKNCDVRNICEHSAWKPQTKTTPNSSDTK